MDLTAIAVRVAQASPFVAGAVPVIQGRVLVVDGDGLAYYCAGNDDTTIGEARSRATDKVRSAMQAVGAESALIVLTGRSSHKGHRYAIARRVPYQSKRSGERPKNWQAMREWLESPTSDAAWKSTIVYEAEADDVLAFYAETEKDCVIYSDDKDMRMLPGLHLDWRTHRQTIVKRGEWAVVTDDEVYGRKWFWLQVLQGDSADSIPGLPHFKDGVYTAGIKRGQEKLSKVGPATAAKILANVHSDMGAMLEVQRLYQGTYGDRWLVELAEQGILLWLRRDSNSHWGDVFLDGAPFAPLRNHADFVAAYAEISARVSEPESYGTTEAEDDGSGDGALIAADIARDALRTVQATVLADERSARSLPPDGGDPSDAAPGVQLGARQDRECVQAVRRTQPQCVFAWGVHLHHASR